MSSGSSTVGAATIQTGKSIVATHQTVNRQAGCLAKGETTRLDLWRPESPVMHMSHHEKADTSYTF